jgi:hypothetical protein
MPRYFLNLRSDASVDDAEGMFLEDAEAARREAIRSARDILAAEVRHGRLPLDGAIEVTDEYGQPILTVPFGEAVVIRR